MAATHTKYLPRFSKLNDCAYFLKPSTLAPILSEKSDTTTTGRIVLSSDTEKSSLASSHKSALSSTPISSIATPIDVPQPDLVLLLGWGGAPLQYVAKYTKAYIDLFPTTPLLLVLTPFSHLMLHTKTSQDAGLAPVLQIIGQYVGSGRMSVSETGLEKSDDEATGQREPRLLVHTFSNGGSYKLVEIALRYRRATSSALPVTSLFLDSTPGLPAVRRSVAALLYALPKHWLIRMIGRTCFWFGLLVLKLWHIVIRREPLMIAMRRHLNDQSLISGQARRSYLYSDTDELVNIQDVEEHAEEAAAKGIIVRKELFVGSQHVAHARAESARYWSIVQEEWHGSVRGEETNNSVKDKV